MKKLTIQNLSCLSESDRGLLFNYFSAMSAARHRPKLAFMSAAAGGLTIALVHFTDRFIFSESINLPEWFAYITWLVNFVIPIGTFLVVFGNLFAARSFQRDMLNYEKELTARGLDASGLTFDDVFEHVAIPMFRQQGLKIKE